MRRTNPLLEALADPSKNFLAFLLIGIFGLGIISSGLSNLLLETLGTWLQKNLGIDKVHFQLTVLGLISLAILSTIYFTDFTRKLRTILGREEIKITNVIPLQGTYFGLIAIASFSQPGKQTPAEIAIRHHWNNSHGKLRYCWLLCTPKVLEATQQRLRTLTQECQQQGIPLYTYIDTPQVMPPISQVGKALHIRLVPLSPEHINDPNQIRQLIDSLYTAAQQQTGLPPTDLIADYTGGTKSMTAGMVLACSQPDRHLQYLASEYNEHKRIVRSQLMQIILSYRIKAIKRGNSRPA